MEQEHWRAAVHLNRFGVGAPGRFLFYVPELGTLHRQGGVSCISGSLAGASGAISDLDALFR